MEELSARGTDRKHGFAYQSCYKAQSCTTAARKSAGLCGPWARLFRPWNMISFMQILWVRACVRDIRVMVSTTLCNPIKADKKKSIKKRRTQLRREISSRSRHRDKLKNAGCALSANVIANSI